MPLPQPGRGKQCRTDELAGPGYCIREVEALAETGRDRAGQRASRAVRVLRVDASIFPAGDLAFRADQAVHDHLALCMAALDEQDLTASSQFRLAAQRLEFRQVGCR